MNPQTTGLRVAGTIFGLVAVLQLVRLLAGIEIVAGGLSVPFWPSVVAFVVAGGLCVWLWRLSYRGPL